MGLLGRIRMTGAQPPAPAPAAAPVVSAVLAGPELGEDDLEQVVGGLERVYVPGLAAAG
jgi:hypothetical protein